MVYARLEASDAGDLRVSGHGRANGRTWTGAKTESNRNETGPACIQSPALLISTDSATARTTDDDVSNIEPLLVPSLFRCLAKCDEQEQRVITPRTHRVRTASPPRPSSLATSNIASARITMRNHTQRASPSHIYVHTEAIGVAWVYSCVIASGRAKMRARARTFDFSLAPIIRVGHDRDVAPVNHRVSVLDQWLSTCRPIAKLFGRPSARLGANVANFGSDSLGHRLFVHK